MKKFLILVLLLLSVIGPSYILHVSGQSITPEIIADLKNVSEVSISPDGKDIAYILRMPGEDASGMQKSVLMTVPKAGGASKTILYKHYNPSAISWSNDGKKIFYITADTVKKIKQLYFFDMVGKVITQ